MTDNGGQAGGKKTNSGGGHGSNRSSLSWLVAGRWLVAVFRDLKGR